MWPPGLLRASLPFPFPSAVHEPSAFAVTTYLYCKSMLRASYTYTVLSTKHGALLVIAIVPTVIVLVLVRYHSTTWPDIGHKQQQLCKDAGEKFQKKKNKEIRNGNATNPTGMVFGGQHNLLYLNLILRPSTVRRSLKGLHHSSYSTGTYSWHVVVRYTYSDLVLLVNVKPPTRYVASSHHSSCQFPGQPTPSLPPSCFCTKQNTQTQVNLSRTPVRIVG